jgi:hypothetical protein
MALQPPCVPFHIRFFLRLYLEAEDDAQQGFLLSNALIDIAST